ncbi:MAG: hypothetical protein IPI83_08680 [Sphingomonadales bacterium]|nr:hypothetical protein [Sphingomonadales bacterium]
MSNSNSFGKALYSALRDREPIGPLSEQDSTLTVDDAYAISLEFLALRQKDGERVIGKKIGVTSKAVQDMSEYSNLQLALPILITGGGSFGTTVDNAGKSARHQLRHRHRSLPWSHVCSYALPDKQTGMAFDAHFGRADATAFPLKSGSF